MGIFDRFSRRVKVQAARGYAEGADANMIAESGIAMRAAAAASVPGTTNLYTTASDQCSAIYRKYNGEDEFGNAEVRTIVDIRSAFIAGEGLSVSTEDEELAEWISGFLESSRLSGSKFFDAVRGSEMTGRALFILSPNPGDFPDVVRVPGQGFPYKVKRASALAWAASSVVLGEGEDGITVPRERFVYVRTSGDDSSFEAPTTRVGVVLTACENYDRALKDMRRLNYIGARVTPTFKTETKQDTDEIVDWIRETKWRLGDAFVGRAELDYKSPNGGAYENLKTELASTAKEMSSITSVPVHWLGHVDLMSNRATADDLYHVINNGTIGERTLFAEAIRELILKAQAMYIDNGGTELALVNRNFTVSIPSIDYGRFESMVRALSQAYLDEAISIDDYRAQIPGIDPLRTRKAIEKSKAEAPRGRTAIADVRDRLDDPEDDNEEGGENGAQ